MLSRTALENARPDGFPVLEVVPDGDDGPRRFVPLKRSELRGEVAGPLAALCLTQTFGFGREAFPGAVEAAYRFPLPGDAAVCGVRVRFGDVEIVAAVRERGVAEADYAAARAEGRQAALLTRESPDVFTLQVAGVRPDEDVVVETAYAQVLRPEGAGFSLRVPLTTAPRYVREDERGARHAAGQPLGLLRDPGHRFALDLLVHRASGDTGDAGVSSPTHRLRTEPDPDGVRVRLAAGDVLPDRDCVLVCAAPRPATGAGRLTVWLQEGYFLALAVPPEYAGDGDAATLPREAILLVDHSGSMGGPKWAAADWAVEHFLAGLSARDAFALGLFHDTATWLDGRPRPGDARQVQRAVAFLKGHGDSGGTNLGVALEQALRLPRSATGEPAARDERARHVLVLTDAQVSDAGRVLRLADAEAGRPDRRRISVLCIDSAPNAFLATELAARGGGTARFLTSDPEAQDVTTALEGVLAEWAAPVLAGMRLEVDRPGAEAAGGQATGPLPVDAAAGAPAGGTWIDLGDLPAGRAVWVAGRLPPGDRGSAGHGGAGDAGTTPRFRLTAATAVVEGEVTRAGAAHASGSTLLPALKALFGARRVVGLEYLLHAGLDAAGLDDGLRRLGYDPAAVRAGAAPGGAPAAPPPVYAENAHRDAATALRGLLVSEALAYGLASAETAFVATRAERGEPVAGTVAVANALPHGWSPDFLGGLGIARSRMLLASQPPRSAVAGDVDYAAPPVSRRQYRTLAAVAPSAPALRPRQRPAGVTGPRRTGVKQTGPSWAARTWAMLTGGGAPPPPGETDPWVPGPAAPAPAVVVFRGTPALGAGRTALFESGDGAPLPAEALLTGLRVRLRGGDPADPALAALLRGLTVALYVDDPAAPRARADLLELLLQGPRPLNVRRRRGEWVRVALEAPPSETAPSWPDGVALEVALEVG